MLSDDVKKEFDKYNHENKAQYKPTCPRMAKVHEQDHDEADHPDRIPSTTPGAEPPRDARDSGSARSHSTHLETSSSDRP